MLSDDAPVRLRLLVTQATAQDATSGGLHEFSESLAYFERPNAEVILGVLHARAAVAPPARRQETEIAEPVVERAPEASSPEGPVRKRRSHVARVAAAILLLAITGLLVRAGSRTGRMASVVEGLKSVVAAPAEATTIGTPESPADSPKDKGTKEAGAAQTTAAGAKNGRGPRRAAVPVVSASAITLPPTSTPAASIVMVEPVLEDVLSPQASYVIEATSVESSDRIYSRSDASVTPPRQVYPALPADPAPGARREDLTVLDLVVAANGLVEHVRLRTEPRNVHEFMLVSAAKAWRFEPATVDGRPVRFRHSVAITSSD
jgi:protein TonB